MPYQNIQIPSVPFYMIRHGETIANEQDVYAGIAETPLTAKGIAQAQAARPMVDALSPAPVCLVTSTLSRARDTGRIITQNLSLPTHEETMLCEQNFGLWTGKSCKDCRARKAKGEAQPGGETKEGFYLRALMGIKLVLSKYAAPALISTHGGVFDAFAVYHGFPLIDVKNCELWAYRPASKGRKAYWGPAFK